MAKGSKTKLLWEDPTYRENMRIAHLGQAAWNKGLKTGLYPKSAFKKGNLPWNKGKKQIIPEHEHYKWKGDMVGYNALHAWVRKQLGRPTECTNGHIAPKYYWANISGEYKRDVTDWHQLCQSCNQLDGIKKHERFRL